MKEDIALLKEWVERDRALRNNSAESDYEKFCERNCIAIENILNRLEQLEKENKELQLNGNIILNLTEQLEKGNRELQLEIYDLINETVPKSVIREKIKDIKLAIAFCENEDRLKRLSIESSTLKELLGGSNE